MFSLVGLVGLLGLSLLIQLVAVIWQIAEAFRGTPTKTWGVFSIIGLRLMMIPNLLWVLVHWDRGWPMLVTMLGAIPPALAGYWLIYMEFATTAAGL